MDFAFQLLCSFKIDFTEVPLLLICCTLLTGGFQSLFTNIGSNVQVAHLQKVAALSNLPMVNASIEMKSTNKKES